MMFAVLTLYFLIDKKFIALIGVYSAAMLSHRDALFLFPLVAVFVIYNFVKAVLSFRKSKVKTVGAILKNKEFRPIFTIPVSIVGFAIISYLVVLPTIINSLGAGYFTFFYNVYLKPLGSFELFGKNSLGVFNLFTRNGVELSVKFPKAVFAVIFAVIITAIVLLVYLSKKNRANLVFLAGYIIFTLATYFVGFDEFGLLTALGIMLMSYLVVRDRRILIVFGFLSILVMVNAASAMAVGDCFNNNDYMYFQESFKGSAILSGGYSAINIICSVLAVLTHLYATMLLLDISMSSERKLLPYVPNASFATAMKGLLKIEKRRGKK